MILLDCLMRIFVGAVVAGHDFFQRAAQVAGTSPDVMTSELRLNPNRLISLFILSSRFGDMLSRCIGVLGGVALNVALFLLDGDGKSSPYRGAGGI